MKTLALALSVTLVYSLSNGFAQEALQNSDVGNVATPGGAIFSEGVLKVTGVGAGMTPQGDSFHYVWQAVSNHYNLHALVDPQPKAEAALAIRGSESDVASPGLWVGFSKEGGITLTCRGVGGGEINKTTFSVDGDAPLYLRLSRRDNEIDVAYSEDGLAWSSLKKVLVTLPDRTIAGFAVAASVVSEATFHSPKIESMEEIVEGSENDLASNPVVGMTGDAQGDQVTDSESNANSTDGNVSSVETATGGNQAVGGELNIPEKSKKIYVNKQLGSDLCDGSSSLRSGVVGPKKTIAAALELARSGDEIIVAPGTYTLSELSPKGEIAITPVGEIILQPETSNQ